VRSRLLALAVGTIALLMIATSSFAHHAWAVDTTRSITVKGTVTGVDWSNPHIQIFVDTKDSNGNVEKWTVGGPSPSRMAGNGWDKNTLKAGDVITAVGQRATDSPNLLKTQKVVLSSGREMVAYGGN
jgi:uncharacterized protein DUF6152